MTVRERFLAMGVLGFVTLAGVALMVSQFVLSPLRERGKRIDGLKADIADKRDKIAAIFAEKPKLEMWRKLSLPADIGLARLEYEKYLRKMLGESGFETGTFSVTPRPLENRTGLLTTPGKKDPSFTSITFAVQATGELPELVDFMERFYRTPLLHQIKNLNITRPLTPTIPAGPGGPRLNQQPKRDLDITMSVEALVLHEADTRNQLLPSMDRQLAAVDLVTTLCNGPAVLALIPWATGPTGPLGPGILAVPTREYASIGGKDIFYGPPVAEQVVDKVDATEHVYLTDISFNGRWEAFLYDRYNNSKTRLRATAGFDSFRIRDSKGETLAQGKIVRIEDRDVYFKSGEKYYSMHVGQNLEEALKHPLGASELKELGLTENKLETKK